MSNDTRPEIRFPGFTEDWEERKLGDIFVYKQGQQVPVENQFTKRGKNRHRFIRIVDLTTNNEAPRYIEYSGDNIISSTDLFMIRYGQPGVIGYGYEGVIANNLFKLIPKIETYNLFFKYILDSMYPKIQSLSSSTTMPAISFKSLDVLAVRYPDKKEQEKIGSFFAQLDNTIALHQRKLDLLKETKKGFLQKMFPKNGAKVPEIRFPGFTGDWEERKFGEIVQVSRGLTYKPSDVQIDGIRVLRSSNINEDVFILRDDDVFVKPDAVNIAPIKNGDILITSANGSSRLVGKHAIVNGLQDKTVHGGFMLRVKSKNTWFTNSLMSSRWYNYFINIYVSGGNGAIGNLRKYDLESQTIIVPDDEEQQKIGNFFKQLDDTITLHQRKLDLLKETKKGFLQKMFV
ncbi:restriction endonuclease subunit S [Enterococcus faecalis]|nr:restriction endonuclease subunit S [Enterococcus faecalis]EGO2824901.1 restriction endonuclease subunit S [Enterococcus faecalis]EGO5017395.1 restriction endonuclease subunit S [Enterococcus faecalis]EGO6112306.1 restriction endonuclease subunit S [Enterococcus faecalis]EGO7552130.1 restriction endonuclease subunit S [Enterococcus faecalis]EGO7560684.1 restriction endonuclease subunit S [Enterococcus faecalis]